MGGAVTSRRRKRNREDARAPRPPADTSSACIDFDVPHDTRARAHAISTQEEAMLMYQQSYQQRGRSDACEASYRLAAYMPRCAMPTGHANLSPRLP